MIHYTSELLGMLTIKQGERKYKIQIRRGNCLAVFLYVYKIENPSDPKRPWMHQLFTFYNDESHLKRCIKNRGCMFDDKVVSIRLNVYYKESMTLLKHMARCGYKVTCYYKEPKK